MTKFFQKKVVVITGASSGIGKSCAHQLANKGANIVLASRNIHELERIQKDLRPANHLSIKTDITQLNDVKSMVATVMDHYRRIDILINNAGKGLSGSVITAPLECFQEIMDVNLWGTLYCIREIYPHMRKQKSGTIVNVSSVAGFKGFPDSGMYSATKFAVNGLTESLSWEAAQNNVNLLLVCPGKTYTRFEKNLAHNDRQSNQNRKGITADFAAKKIIQGIEANKNFIVIGKHCVPLYLLNRLSPSLTNFVINHIY
jgi:short-subunit dehydrogenase